MGIHNLSPRLRAGIPLKAFPARVLAEDPKPARERGLAIEKKLQHYHFFENVELTNLERRMFGLHYLIQETT